MHFFAINGERPVRLSEKTRKEVEDIAIRAFKGLGSAGNSRIDFLIDEKTNICIVFWQSRLYACRAY